MHSPGAGYARLAQEAIAVLGLVADVDMVPNGFADDRILSQPPNELDLLVRLLTNVRDIRRLNHVDLDCPPLLDDRLHLADELEGTLTAHSSRIAWIVPTC
jgi:hypothetical protein